MTGVHAPEAGCRCGLAHCAACGEVWPCRAVDDGRVFKREYLKIRVRTGLEAVR